MFACYSKRKRREVEEKKGGRKKWERKAEEETKEFYHVFLGRCRPTGMLLHASWCLPSFHQAVNGYLT